MVLEYSPQIHHTVKDMMHVHVITLTGNVMPGLVHHLQGRHSCVHHVLLVHVLSSLVGSSTLSHHSTTQSFMCGVWQWTRRQNHRLIRWRKIIW